MFKLLFSLLLIIKNSLIFSYFYNILLFNKNMDFDNKYENLSEDEFKKKLNEKIEKYFKNHKFLEEKNLKEFLKEINLDEWESEEEIQYLWIHLSQYSNTYQLNYEETKKGINDFIFDSTDNNMNNRMSLRISKRLSKNIKNKEIKEKKNLKHLLEETEPEYLRKILCYFKMLHFQKREIITEQEIRNITQKCFLLKIYENDLIEFIHFFAEKIETDLNIEYKINRNEYFNIEQNLLNIIKPYKKDYLNNKINEYGNSNSYYNEIINDIIDNEKESEIYSDFIQQEYESDNNYLKDELIFLSERRQIKEEILREFCYKFENDIKELKDEYIKLNEQMTNLNNNNNEEYDLKINNLMEEINALKRDKERKIDKINSLNNYIKDMEIENQKIINEKNEKENNIINLKNKIDDLLIKNQALETSYKFGVDEVLKKIQLENKRNEENENQKILDENIILENESQINLFKGMSIKDIMNYSIKIKNENKNLMNEINDLENKILELDKKEKENLNIIEENKENVIILKSENDKLKTELEEIKNENELNKMFRPSNILRLSLQKKEEKKENQLLISKTNKGILFEEIKPNQLERENIYETKKSEKKSNMSKINKKSELRILKAKDAINKLDLNKNNNETNLPLRNPFEMAKEVENSISTSKTRKLTELNKINIQPDLNNLNPIKRNKSFSPEFNYHSINKSLSINKINPDSISQFLMDRAKNLSGNEIENKNNNNSINKDIRKNFDNLYLKNYTKIINYIEDTNRNFNSYELFTDDCYLLDIKTKMRQYILTITNETIILFDLLDFSSNKIIQRSDLKKVLVSNENLNLIIFRFNINDDLILEVMRRRNLLEYLKKNVIVGIIQDEIEFIKTNQFIYNEGKEIKKKILYNFRIFNYFPYFEYCNYFGYLLRYKQILKSKFVEKFIVLTDMGLIIFNNPLLPPKHIISLEKSKINKYKGITYGKPFGFEIISYNQTYIFFAKTEECLNKWVIEIQKITQRYLYDIKNFNFINESI